MRAVIFGNNCHKEVARYTGYLLQALAERGVELMMERDYHVFLRHNGVNVDQYVNERNYIDYTDYDADYAFVVGGDGTFIHSAAKLGGRDIPMVGINAGRLGFLTDIDGSHIYEMVEQLMNKNYTITERTLLEVATKGNSNCDLNFSLNEISVSKLDSASLITIHTWVDGTYLTSYQADGLLISTSTGSTAYSMSVGGPILTPQVPALILTPVAPHSLTMRPLVIPDTSKIELQVESRNNRYLLAIDGQNNVFDEHIKLSICKSPFKIKSLQTSEHNFFDTLRQKLMWGADNRHYLKKGYDEPDEDSIENSGISDI